MFCLNKAALRSSLIAKNYGTNFIMNDTTNNSSMNEKERNVSGLKIFLFVLVALVIAMVGTLLVIRFYVFPTEFKPVTLNAKEERLLEDKLERLDITSAGPSKDRSKKPAPIHKASEFDREGSLVPERYSEEGARREIEFSERELNALIAKNTDLASRLTIDLSDKLVSAKLLLPVSEDFPVMGGEVLKVRAGLELAYDRGRPIVVLRGISVMGVPLPNAWLGGVKNIDLVKEYGGDAGFWRSFSEGVEYIRVEEGRLKIKLKE